MTDIALLTVAELRLMQDLARRIAASRLELIGAEATFGELAWNWGRGHAALRPTWPCRLWFSERGEPERGEPERGEPERGEPEPGESERGAGELVAWGWARLPHRVHRSDGVVQEVKGAQLVYQVDPAHAGLVDEVIDWFDATAGGLERTVVAAAADEFGLRRWAEHGYEPDSTDGWTQLNVRDLVAVPEPVLPAGFRFSTAAEAGPAAAVQAHMDAWAPSSYSAEAYEGVRRTSGYRSDLHVLVLEGATPVASAIMWFDEVTRSVEFEPVGTHPAYRRRGLGRALMLHGMRLGRAAGATHALVACLGGPEHPAARELYYGVGFREVSRDAPLIKAV